MPARIRLLEKRPLMFVGLRDRYVLRNHDPNDEAGRDGMGGFEAVGTEAETPPLLMRDYLTYDEVKLSALLATCSPTATINKGDRHNKGISGKEGTFIRCACVWQACEHSPKSSVIVPVNRSYCFC